ncbi:Uu.00g147240.m01.CDS01 [Anthostomella pinea]|uniref:Uu.00g147240.m01.CDS01 n=1 Tax=Anthostomella pinea TaxID=933095 RepID=A0AAI8VRF7_9PEZI|nr:Uu.00g147240.m01.CDS01 [Anthostomella pinea]
MRSPAFPPRRPSHLIRYIFPAVLLLCLFFYLSHDTSHASDAENYMSAGHGSSTHRTPETDSPPVQQPIPNSHEQVQNVADDKKQTPDKHDAPVVESSPKGDWKSKGDSKSKPQQPDHETPATHPIDQLIDGAEKDFTSMLAKQSRTLAEAADAYRKRRGRHPPPGFDKWYNFAKENDAVMVEDFFDQIYHDLNPFWGVDPRRIRKEAWDFEMTINIRSGSASAKSDWFWTQIWLDMFKTIEHLLPDMDIALNAMDEPRVIVPWEDMSTLMRKGDQARVITPVKNVVREFQSLPAPGKGDKSPATREKYWEDTDPYWAIARRGCSPDSPARKTPILESYNDTPSFSPSWATPHQYQGYVSNFTLSTEFCHQPDLQGLEGIFIKPLSTSTTQVLFPLFGGSKLATNNEILLPAPMYWNEEERFTGGDDHGPPWKEKFGDLIWRGVATGGRNNESNWRGFQRHRFVSMNNGTKLTRAEEEVERPNNFELPDTIYNIAAQKEQRLGSWVSQWADVGFTDLFCDPDFKPQEDEARCPYTDAEYDVVLGQTLGVQFNYKYLPDVDGNSFSGRYLGFLRSTSLPIKSTMWHEWHDSRLVAWKHFVPMDNRFNDYYGIMEYFLGYEDSVPSHDAAAEKIAMDGKAWAEKVLRREDMQIYALRLLLEYARISDDRRETMGWVDDLLS